MSPVMQYARQVLQDAIDRIDNDECSEVAVEQFLARTNAESRGYFRKESYVNYDQAMRLLNIGNRVTLKAYLDKHGVKMNRVNNMPVGFLRSEVEALAERADFQPPKKRRGW